MDSLGVGVIGCGNISSIYLGNLQMFQGVEVRGCADLRPDTAQAQGARFGVRAMTIDELLGDPAIQIVVNLTVPNAHFTVSMDALSAGKHVFSEKPLCSTVEDGRRLCAEARTRDLRLGVAPDTFLGAGGRLARHLVDQGSLGTIVAGTAYVMSRGMEHWHPNPEFFFKRGGGPVFDLGPYYLTTLVNLLGPIAKVGATAAIGLPERVVTSQSPFRGQRIAVEVPTTAMSLLEFASGARVTLTLSWDVWRHGHAPIELYGTEGSLRVPDPNFYGGIVELAERDGDWRQFPTADRSMGAPNWPAVAPKQANYRALGVADLAAAIDRDVPHRCSGELGLHVLEVMQAIVQSGETGSFVAIESPCRQPEELTEGGARDLLPAGVVEPVTFGWKHILRLRNSLRIRRA